MLRFISFLLACAIFVQPASASQTTRQGLKVLFDELHYGLTVEWDQHDREVYAQKHEAFKQGLEELRLQGLTNEELASFARERMTDERQKADFDRLLLTLQLNNLPAAEANKMVSELVKKSYGQGANWNSNAGVIALGAVLLGLVTLIIVGAVQCNNGNWDCTCGETADDPCVTDSSDDDYDDDDDWDNDWCTEVYVCDDYYDGSSYCYYDCY